MKSRNHPLAERLSTAWTIRGVAIGVKSRRVLHTNAYVHHGAAFSHILTAINCI